MSLRPWQRAAFDRFAKVATAATEQLERRLRYAESWLRRLRYAESWLRRLRR